MSKPVSRKPSMPRMILSVSVSPTELRTIDDAAHGQRVTRSVFLREAGLEKAKRLSKKVAA